MVNWFAGLNPILQALIATLFTWFVTALGAGLVFFFKTINRKVLDGMLGFAAGVMIAASYWSLLAPAIEMAEESSLPAWIPATTGFQATTGDSRRASCIQTTSADHHAVFPFFYGCSQAAQAGSNG